jgi:plastocyanin
MSIRRVLRAATVALLTVAPAISIGCAQHKPRSHVVKMENMAFQPAELTVSRGDTVVWNNEDFVPHTATARDGSWDSKSIAPGGDWRLVVDEPGRQAYHCLFHPNMVGTIDAR